MLANHLTSEQLERLVSEDLPPSTLEAATAHVQSCEACTAAKTAIESAAEAFLARFPEDRVLQRALGSAWSPSPERAQVTPSARPRLLPLSRRVVQLSAAATILFAVLATVRQTSGPVLRAKGGNALSLHRKRGEEVKPLAPGEAVRLGDGLRLVLATISRARWMAWVVDANGRVDRAVSAPILLEPGLHALPGGLQVEAPCLRSTFVAIPVEVDADVAAAEAQLRHGEATPPGAVTAEVACE